MEKIFQEFLMKNGIEDFFDREQSDKLEFNENIPRTWISGRFLWEEQPEDWRFWVKLEREWQEICKEQEFSKK
jgi:hypothetical protein